MTDTIESLRAQVIELQAALAVKDEALKEWPMPECANARECFGGNRYGFGCHVDELSSAAGGKPWHECFCGPESLWKALAAKPDTSALEAYVMSRQPVCTWSPDKDFEGDTWDGACGAKWSFIEGGPVENDLHFCPRCGGEVVLKEASPLPEGKN